MPILSTMKINAGISYTDFKYKVKRTAFNIRRHRSLADPQKPHLDPLRMCPSYIYSIADARSRTETLIILIILPLDVKPV